MLEALGGAAAVFVLDLGTKASAFAGVSADRRREAEASRRERAAPEAGRRAPVRLLGIRPVHNRVPWAWHRGSTSAWIGAYAAALAATAAVAYLGILDTPLARVGVGLALGGALGNLCDRLRHGAIRDFLYVELRPSGWSNTFNLADVGIVAGLLCVSGSCLSDMAAAWSPAG